MTKMKIPLALLTSKVSIQKTLQQTWANINGDNQSKAQKEERIKKN